VKDYGSKKNTKEKTLSSFDPSVGSSQRIRAGNPKPTRMFGSYTSAPSVTRKYTPRETKMLLINTLDQDSDAKNTKIEGNA
jgi:hypothetical protein